MAMPKKIEEVDIEVINLNLTQEERVVLYSCCKQYMTEDAWLAVGQNMTHIHEIKPLMLPVYTEAEEKFWLLYGQQTIGYPQSRISCKDLGLLDGHENW